MEACGRLASLISAEIPAASDAPRARCDRGAPSASAGIAASPAQSAKRRRPVPRRYAPGRGSSRWAWLWPAAPTGHLRLETVARRAAPRVSKRQREPEARAAPPVRPLRALVVAPWWAARGPPARGEQGAPTVSRAASRAKAVSVYAPRWAMIRPRVAWAMQRSVTASVRNVSMVLVRTSSMLSWRAWVTPQTSIAPCADASFPVVKPRPSSSRCATSLPASSSAPRAIRCAGRSVKHRPSASARKAPRA